MSERSGRRGRAVVLTSGGMDSCVTLAIAAQRYDPFVLHASYGQRTASREMEAFEAIADHFAIPAAARRRLDISFLAQLGGSALTDHSIAVPESWGSDEIPCTYVPFRNAHLLAAAVSWAELIEAESIFIGAVEEDSSGYPDCREQFLSAFERAVRLGTAKGGRFEIVAPLLHSSKAEIVRRGLELGAPLHLSWSCYQEDRTACGVCESCRLRRRGFELAGATDPISYRVD